MQKFCPGQAFGSVDEMKTAFRACQVPMSENDAGLPGSEECRSLLRDLTGGDDESKYGTIFKQISDSGNAASNISIFPYYRALSKQVHWFCVSRKASQHRLTIKSVKAKIADIDRQLWKSELTEQAFSVYDDFLTLSESIKNGEIHDLKKFIKEANEHVH
jgi:hypothetical protein